MTYQLTIEPIGEVVEVEEGQTVLDACLRAGIYIPYQCNHGLCSTCKIDVLEGEVNLGEASPFALMDFERDEGKALACCCTLESDTVIEAEIEEDEDAQYLPIEDFEGKVSEIADLTPDIKAIHIALTGDGIEFQAGQYIQLDIPGVEGPRAFSLANAPQKPCGIELHVRLVPDGAGTTYLHQKLKAGDDLSFSGPYGQFFVRKSQNKPMIFIAGGSGLSSPKSMIEDLLAEGCSEKIYLFHGVRGRQDLYYDDYFRELEGQHENFTYVPALSEKSEGDDWSGETGFINEVAERFFDGEFKGHQAYLCGPPPMIEASIRTLMKGRLFEKDIYMEKFLTREDGQDTKKSPLFKRI
ncbi:2Fe-2S iron-sulfur cluster binding domain-containing protein [Emcibacter sp.]|uniref:NADH:ubiquinone reductase (Na(+)-transporting) subunit F n=1 Tax=Emcibacter sp. TaxID=1979954 RepID=UPI002AA79B72|nr:2Fe-2S iron-sulfur cluster binding domain-containing protein [Emcibacter sp.]